MDVFGVEMLNAFFEAMVRGEGEPDFRVAGHGHCEWEVAGAYDFDVVALLYKMCGEMFVSANNAIDLWVPCIGDY